MSQPSEYRQQLAKKITAMRAQGMLHREIAAELGYSSSYISAVATDPDASKQAVRRLGYQGVCQDCGGPTSGSEGRKKAPTVCAKCQTKRVSKNKYWTQERIIQEIQRFVHENGRRPVSTEWLGGKHGVNGDGYPYVNAVMREFGSWANAIEAAGFERPWKGNKIRRRRPESVPRRPRKMPRELDELIEEIRQGAVFGVAPSSSKHKACYQALLRRGLSWREACEMAGVRPRKKNWEY